MGLYRLGDLSAGIVITSSAAMPYNSTPTGPFPSVTPSSTSLSLLQRVKDQDPDAWRRLVRLYGPVVFLWCRRAGLTGPDAADAVQKVWMSVATHLAEFHREPPKDSFRGWLRTITRRKLIDGCAFESHRQSEDLTHGECWTKFLPRSPIQRNKSPVTRSC